MKVSFEVELDGHIGKTECNPAEASFSYDCKNKHKIDFTYVLRAFSTLGKESEEGEHPCCEKGCTEKKWYRITKIAD